MNTLKTSELYTLNWQLVCYIKSISVKLLRKITNRTEKLQINKFHSSRSFLIKISPRIGLRFPLVKIIYAPCLPNCLLIIFGYDLTPHFLVLCGVYYHYASEKLYYVLGIKNLHFNYLLVHFHQYLKTTLWFCSPILNTDSLQGIGLKIIFC